MAKAARHVLLTAERIIDGEECAATPELTAIPCFQVDAVVEAPRGAWPASCAGSYDVDEEYLAEYYVAASSATPGALRDWVLRRATHADHERQLIAGGTGGAP